MLTIYFQDQALVMLNDSMSPKNKAFSADLLLVAGVAERKLFSIHGLVPNVAMSTPLQSCHCHTDAAVASKLIQHLILGWPHTRVAHDATES